MLLLIFILVRMEDVSLPDREPEETGKGKMKEVVRDEEQGTVAPVYRL